MEIRILGTVDIWRDGRSTAIVGLKQRTLLAVMVLNANRVVSHDRLLTALWGTKAPATGRRLLHNHLWSLRRLLTEGDAVESTPTGYLLRLRPGASDLDVFVTETARARSALSEGDTAQASERFRTALSLWRGPALGGTHPELQATEGAALEELRLAALIGRIEADLTLGRHPELIGELRLLVGEHPLNEELRGQLMRALHRAGRTAEALEEFRAGRLHFRDELGLDPGEELTRVHQMILSGETAETGKSGGNGENAPGTAIAASVPAAPGSPVPRQLPADVTRFTGRVEKLRQLDMLLSEEEGTATVVISAIAGTAGVGKTALATHWGHRVAARFPDGQLYVNLHGYSQGRATTGAQALDRLLRGLGVVDDEIPHDVDERAGLYRSLLAHRRMLIVLDNAATPEQVRPLLPGSSPSRVVITSRDALRGLSVTHDVRGIVLDVLPADEATALLNKLLGRNGTDDETDPVPELARLCGYLPLALRLAAAQLAGEPTSRIGDFTAKLRQENRLTVLELREDPGTGVRSALELSYRSLPEPARRTLRLLSVHPGPDIDLQAVAALTAMSAEDASAAVDALLNAHLLQRDGDGRLSMHDLVRVYAGERNEADDSTADRDGALTRMLDWYQYAVLKAMEHLSSDDSASMTITSVDDGIPDLPGVDEAMAWLERERHVLIAVIVHAAEQDRHIHAWQTAALLSWFFYAKNHFDDLFMTGEVGLSSARRIGHRHGEAEILSDLGYAKMFTGRYAEHLSHQQQALDIWRAVKDRKGEAKGLRHVSYALQLAGRPIEAIEVGERCLALSRELGDRTSEFTALDNLAISYHVAGRYEEALEALSKCHGYWREQGREYDEAYCLIQMGAVHTKLGDLTTALGCFEKALPLGRSQGNLRIEVDVFNGIAVVLRHRGSHAEALDHHEKALTLAKTLQSRPLEGELLSSLGETCLASGDSRAALEHYQEASVYADEADDAYQRGFAHAGLGNALHALGRTDDAEKHWRTAFDILSPMDLPEAEVIAERMRAAGLT
ncbi:AfsR/SARP family transcriptional regulator [Streptosporangium roseum]|uniref:AfsR/SARP family transcriptional regulator n=1 Tax=Streptosporangium roseum TaxID=2001 RepID=UPI000AD09DFE|nr:BTAD domain-containing putative transcriptional regulator [Streptosporangium roseum]